MDVVTKMLNQPIESLRPHSLIERALVAIEKLVALLEEENVGEVLTCLLGYLSRLLNESSQGYTILLFYTVCYEILSIPSSVQKKRHTL